MGYYHVAIEKDNYVDVLESPTKDEKIIELYYNLIGIERYKYFVVKGSMVRTPEFFNDLTVIELKNVPEMYDFLEHDEEKGDIYKELKVRINQVYKGYGGKVN